MAKRTIKKPTALLPRKPSKAFISVYQSHCFDDNLRHSGHKNKGMSFGHFVEGKG